MLIDFLRTWNNPHHIAWGESHCPEMVDHALTHSKNLFILSNRLFHDNDNLIDQLNDGEKACYVLSLYLHDIGMSKMLFTPNINNLPEINRYLSHYAHPGDDPQYKSSSFFSSITVSDLSGITPGWIREHHALLSKYLIINNTQIITFGADVHEDIREIVGNICLNHSGKVRLSESSVKRKYYTIPPVDNQNSGKSVITVNSKKYEINILFLSALLRFVDGCDQTNKRLIALLNTDQFIQRNKSERDFLLTEMIQEMKPDDAKTLQMLSDWFDRTDSSPGDSDFFSAVEQLKKKYSKFSRSLDVFSHICHYRRNMDYKKSVKDIYFNEGKIILACADEYYPPDISRVMADILKELQDVKHILKQPPHETRDIGIPTSVDEPYNEESFNVIHGDCSQYEIPVYEPFQQLGAQYYEDRKFIAQKLHEAYIAAERANGNKIVNNPQMHLWNRIDHRYRKANIRHGNDILDYLSIIHATIPPFFDSSDEIFEFTSEELEMLAKIEHERWMKEKVEEGWIYGEERDEKKLIHPCILDWDDLTDAVKEKDRNVIRNLPIVLHSMKLSIKRL
ncbi:RyR domain-containing protein [Methanospirillum hungatei]|nr:RyR domain-containing protein [Methanospirillum hungatei]